MKPVIKLNNNDFCVKVLEHSQDGNFADYTCNSLPLRQPMRAEITRVFETESTIYIETANV